MLAVVLLVSLAIPALGAEPIVYTADTNHTPEEISQAYYAALAAGETYVDNDASSYYSVPSSVEYPYEPGVLTDDTQTAALAMLNYYRWLVGVEPVSAVPEWSDSLQKGALVRYFSFRYAPAASDKPADMDQALWDEGADAKYNLLARKATPQSAIPLWINEGYTLYNGEWNTVGHRMSLLGGTVSGAEFGHSGDVTIGRIVENGGMTQPFAAYPAAGYMPFDALKAGSTAWSVEVNPAVLRPSGSVVVTITNLTTGETVRRTVSEDTVHTGAGSMISFVQPTPANGTSYAPDENYQVHLSGLTDVATGGPAEIEYTVSFMDVREHTPAVVTSCVPSPWNKVFFATKAINNAELQQQVASILPREVTVKTDVGRTLTLTIASDWQVDKANSRFVSSVDAATLPAGVTDPDGLLAEVSIPWATKNSGTIRGVNLNGCEGERATINVTRFSSSYDQIDLYQFTPDGDGWTAQKRFAVSLPETERTVAFTLDPLQLSDSGKYIVLYYRGNNDFKEVHVVNDVTVNVKPAPASVTFLAPNYPWDDMLTLSAETQGAAVLQQPSYPSYLGYTFSGVTVACGDQTEVVAAADGVVATDALNAAIGRVQAASGERAVTVTANYEKNPETYTIRVVNALEDGTELGGYTSDPFVVGNAVRLAASQTRVSGGETYYFDHWEIDGTTYPNAEITLRPNRAGDYTVTAVYKPEEPAAPPASVSILGAEAETVNGVNKTAVTMTWSLPEGCTLVKAGFEVSQKADLSKISTAATKLTTATGTYTLHVKMAGKEGVTLYVRAFLTYTDADGEQHTLYTDPWQEYVWNVLHGTV